MDEEDQIRINSKESALSKPLSELTEKPAQVRSLDEVRSAKRRCQEAERISSILDLVKHFK